MEQNQVDGFPKAPTLPLPPGWEVLSNDPYLKEYRYRAGDTVGAKKTGKYWMRDPHARPWSKEGWVIMYNPSAERLAAWIANATIETSSRHIYNESRALALLDAINCASNAQFPVVGTVWEDLYKLDGADGTDGIQEAFPFLDGTTVLKSPKEFYRPEMPGSRAIEPLDEEALTKGLNLRWENGATPGLARIGSTDREMCRTLWQKMGLTNPPNIDGVNFAFYVRKAYQEAMHGVRNELLVALALSKPNCD